MFNDIIYRFGIKKKIWIKSSPTNVKDISPGSMTLHNLSQRKTFNSRIIHILNRIFSCKITFRDQSSTIVSICNKSASFFPNLSALNLRKLHPLWNPCKSWVKKFKSRKSIKFREDVKKRRTRSSTCTQKLTESVRSSVTKFWKTRTFS